MYPLAELGTNAFHAISLFSIHGKSRKVSTNGDGETFGQAATGKNCGNVHRRVKWVQDFRKLQQTKHRSRIRLLHVIWKHTTIFKKLSPLGHPGSYCLCHQFRFSNLNFTVILPEMHRRHHICIVPPASSSHLNETRTQESLLNMDLKQTKGSTLSIVIRDVQITTKASHCCPMKIFAYPNPINGELLSKKLNVERPVGNLLC